MNKIKCSECNKLIDILELFPKNKCLECYEKKFNQELKKTGVLPKPDFIRSLKR